MNRTSGKYFHESIHRLKKKTVSFPPGDVVATAGAGGGRGRRSSFRPGPGSTDRGLVRGDSVLLPLNMPQKKKRNSNLVIKLVVGNWQHGLWMRQ
jgi:hypothetical protein